MARAALCDAIDADMLKEDAALRKRRVKAPPSVVASLENLRLGEQSTKRAEGVRVIMGSSAAYLQP